ncbi:zinc finger protein 665 isoform X2 [Strongylocentrotus purpuratus]|uniref:Uncharacterized protein n=1 Tax=Strongylocentrotus purpuratus TaxID=7668 RepID=A0A7M7NBV3_STRPU|nr:zinc finger protein 665 isoform X2 [Strongylocentrotus purpuratus]
MDLPYHTTSQHQPEFVVDQPLRPFPVGLHPGAPILRSIYQDSDPLIPASDIMNHQVHQQTPVTVGVGGHGVKSSNLPASLVPPITTHEPVAERNNFVVATCEPVVENNISSIATCQPVLERNSLPVRTYESVVNGNTQQSQGQTPIAPTPSQETQDDEHREQHPTSSHHPIASPPISNDSSKAVEPLVTCNVEESSEVTSRAPELPQSLLFKTSSKEETQLLAALNLKKTKSIQDLPQNLSFRATSEGKVDGVIAKERIEKEVDFGPYTGTLLDEEQGWSIDTTWEICISDRVHFYLDGHNNWMSHLRFAQTDKEENMEAFQSYGKIYFRSTKVVEPGSELKVFYSEDYAKHVGIQTRLKDLHFKQDSQKFQCSQCADLFTSAKLILRHITICEHTSRTAIKVLPVPTKKEKKKISARNKKSAKQPPRKRKKVSNKEGCAFKCGTCEKVFDSRGRLKAHEQFHDYNQDHTCPVCGKRQRNAQTWARHMMLHKPGNEARPHKCNECNGRYKSKAALRKHANEIHGYPCRFCKERFLKKKDCLNHELTHQSFLTSHSGATTDPSAMLVSSAMVLPSEATNATAEPSPDKPKDMLGKTATFYLRNRPYKCRFCPKTYLTRNVALVHEREMHFGDRAYNCSHCSKSFGKESMLVAHLKNHEQHRMYRCTHCPKTFRSESAFNNHQGEHNGLKPFKCELCGRGFRVRKGVTHHKRRMHQDRPMRFFCSVCNKGFTDRGNLIKHERRHDGFRPFECLECGSRFTAKCSLENHARTHVAEKPFSCEICGKTFPRNDYYTHHMFKHKLEDEGILGKGVEG